MSHILHIPSLRFIWVKKPCSFNRKRRLDLKTQFLVLSLVSLRVCPSVHRSFCPLVHLIVHPSGTRFICIGQIWVGMDENEISDDEAGKD